jgi:hypothetical protein
MGPTARHGGRHDSDLDAGAALGRYSVHIRT